MYVYLNIFELSQINNNQVPIMGLFLIKRKLQLTGH